MTETICMKGLILTHMGKRDEGLELVKKGIRLDLTSHICWHVFGLIQKGEKNYEEALKSYTQALKFDKVRLVKQNLISKALINLRKTSTYSEILLNCRHSFEYLMASWRPGTLFSKSDLICARIGSR
jgi:tetratricopeptide (TPR) repeat protein